MEGSRERGREDAGGGFLLNTLTFISALQRTYAGFSGKVRALWVCAHTNAPPPRPDRKRHNEPSVLSTPGGHTQKKALQSLPDLRTSWLLAKVSEIILCSAQYLCNFF